MFAFVVRFSFLQYQAKRLAGKSLSEFTYGILCHMECKTLPQSISQFTVTSHLTKENL